MTRTFLLAFALSFLLLLASCKDGIDWSEPQHLAHIGKGHYQISRRYKKKIATAFNYHPSDGGLNARTNLYYMQSDDFGKTWRNARGQKLELPLRSVDNGALIRDYESQGRLIYLKDLTFDPLGNPIILYVASRGYEAGPKNNPRVWTTARWTAREWETRGTGWVLPPVTMTTTAISTSI